MTYKAKVRGEILAANHNGTWEITGFSIEMEVPLYTPLDSVVEARARELHMKLFGWKTRYVYLHKITSFVEVEE